MIPIWIAIAAGFFGIVPGLLLFLLENPQEREDTWVIDDDRS